MLKERTVLYITLEILKDILSYLDPDLEYSIWFKYLAGVHFEFGDEAKDICKEWSKQSNKYKEKSFESTWASLTRSSSSNPCTMYTLFKDAILAGWARPFNLRAKTRKVNTKEFKNATGTEKRNACEFRELILRVYVYQSLAPSDHPYFLKKRINPNDFFDKKGFNLYGVRVMGYPLSIAPEAQENSLIVPLYDEKLFIQGLQFIPSPNSKWDTKTYLKGSHIKGCFFVITGSLSENIIYVCEGLATAATICSITKRTTYVTFGTGNMCAAVETIRKMHPRSKLIIAADNDKHLEPKSNPGLKMARRASDIFKTDYTFPIFPDDKVGREFTDFNDLFREYGVETTKKQLEGNLQASSKLKKAVTRNSIKKIMDNATLRFLERFNTTVNQHNNGVTL